MAATVSPLVPSASLSDTKDKMLSPFRMASVLFWQARETGYE